MTPSHPLRQATDGFILLNKKPGQTSFQALNPLKKAYGKHLGHSGTLDKFAEGLLVILVGKGTKLVPWVMGESKTYEAVFFFGEETSTLDPEGPVIAQGPQPNLQIVLDQLAHFRGEILQAPPIYSAIHIDGKRAYERALAGQQIEMPSRPVTIHEFEFLGGELPELRFRIHCSKGTYIRSLARDLAKACGTFGHLKQLKRTQVGPFLLKDAQSIEPDSIPPVIPLESLIVQLQIPTHPCQHPAAIKNGKPLEQILSSDGISEGIFGILTPEGNFAALGEKKGTALHYRFVL